jgi:hypothetical protein
MVMTRPLPTSRHWSGASEVHSRMVAGFHLTMDAPLRLSTSLRLLQAVFDKTAWLHGREITEARSRKRFWTPPFPHLSTK